MPLGKRTDLGDSRYAGIEIDFSHDVGEAMQVCWAAEAPAIPCIALHDMHAPMHRNTCCAASTLSQHHWCMPPTSSHPSGVQMGTVLRPPCAQSSCCSPPNTGARCVAAAQPASDLQTPQHDLGDLCTADSGPDQQLDQPGCSRCRRGKEQQPSPVAGAGLGGLLGAAGGHHPAGSWQQPSQPRAAGQ
jgi:hypothetical protein